MIIYGELDPMPEHRTQFAFKGKREHITKLNTKYDLSKPTCGYWKTKLFIRSYHGAEIL